MDAISLKTYENTYDKLPLLDELHRLIFSYLPVAEQQNVTLVNKFWCKAAVCSATTKEAKKIKKFIASLIDELGEQGRKTDNKAFTEMIESLENVRLICLTNNAFNYTSLSSFKDSVEIIKKMMVNILKNLNNLDNLKMPLPPFLFNHLYELASLYGMHDDAKQNKNTSIFNYISTSLADKEDFEKSLEVALDIPLEQRDASLYTLVGKLTKRRKFDLAEQVALLITPNSTEWNAFYLIAKSLAEAGELKRTQELLKKVPLKTDQDDIYEIMAKSFAKHGNFKKAYKMALRINEAKSVQLLTHISRLKLQQQFSV